MIFQSTMSACQQEWDGRGSNPAPYAAIDRLRQVNTELRQALAKCLIRIETDYPDERDRRGSSPRNPRLIRDTKVLARAALAKNDADLDATRMAAGFAETLDLTRKAVEP